MSELEKLKNVLTEIGCKHEIVRAADGGGEEIRTDSYNGEAEYDTVIELDSGIGYTGFGCRLYFLDGKFQGHGCWE